jgi:hypothetical protein
MSERAWDDIPMGVQTQISALLLSTHILGPGQGLYDLWTFGTKTSPEDWRITAALSP